MTLIRGGGSALSSPSLHSPWRAGTKALGELDSGEIKGLGDHGGLEPFRLCFII